MTARGVIALATVLSSGAFPCVQSFGSAQQEAQAPPAGQAAPLNNPTTVFKANVRRVVVDVVVTDSKGQPVSGLTKANFSVTEDGKPQQILSFDANGFNSGMDWSARLEMCQWRRETLDK